MQNKDKCTGQELFILHICRIEDSDPTALPFDGQIAIDN